MAELILTEEEKAAALWSDLDDAALGALVKRKISLITEVSEQLDRVTTFSAAMMLCLAARHAGANKASFDIEGLTEAGIPVGNWRIIAELMLPEQLIKRTWAYLQQPRAFEVAPCECGNADTQWSEFEGHCWCEHCQKDFVPEHGGVFDGPIPIQTAAMLGFRFDRVILATQQVEIFDIDSGEYRTPNLENGQDDS